MRYARGKTVAPQHKFSPVGINNRGDVWGLSYEGWQLEASSNYKTSSVLWTGDANLTPLPEPPGPWIPVATWMNDRAIVAGLAMHPGDQEAPRQAFIWTRQRGYRLLQAGDARFDDVYITNQGVVGATLLYHCEDYGFAPGPYRNPFTGRRHGSQFNVPSATLFVQSGNTWEIVSPDISFELKERMERYGESGIPELAQEDAAGRPRGFRSWIRPPRADGSFLVAIATDSREQLRPAFYDPDGVLQPIDMPFSVGALELAQPLFLCAHGTLIGRKIELDETEPSVSANMWLAPDGESGTFDLGLARPLLEPSFFVSPGGHYVASSLCEGAHNPFSIYERSDVFLWRQTAEGRFTGPVRVTWDPEFYIYGGVRGVNDKGQLIVSHNRFRDEFAPDQEFFLVCDPRTVQV